MVAAAPIETTASRTLSPTVAWSLAIGATLTMAVSYFDRQAFAALSPTILPALGMQMTELGLLGSGFAWAYMIGSPLAGRLIERIGPRRGLPGAVVTWSIVAALHSLVPGFGTLLGMRIALGFTESPSFPGAAKTVERALPPNDRARGFGLLFTGSSFGALAAPFVAGGLESRYGWRVALLGSAFVGLAWIPMWLFLTRSTAARTALDVATAPSTEERGLVPILDALRHKAVQRAAVVVLASAPTTGFVLTMSPNYLATVERVAQADLPKYLWIPPVLFDIGALAFGHFASVHQRKHAGQPARLLFFLCGLLGSTLALVLVIPGPYAAAIIAGAALAGVGGLFAIFTSDMLSRVPVRLVSTSAGITAASQSLAHIVSLPLAGYAIDKTGSYVLAVATLSAVVMPGVVAWLVWKPPPMREA